MAGNNIHSQLTDQAEIHVPKGFTEASNSTVPIKNISGTLQWVSLSGFGLVQCNFVATTDPLVTSDSSIGYAVGSRWCNTTLNTMFTCVNASIGTALWVYEAMDNPAATRVPTNTDDDTRGFRAGSVWVDVSAGNALYICNSSATGAASWVQIEGPVFVGQIDVATANFSEIAATGRYLDVIPYQSSDQLSYTVINTGQIVEMSLQASEISTGTVGIFESSNLVTPILTISLTAQTKFVVTGQVTPVTQYDELVFQVTSGTIYTPFLVVKIAS